MDKMKKTRPTDRALEFVCELHHSSMKTLVTAISDNKAVNTVLELSELESWIAENDGKANLFYMANQGESAKADAIERVNAFFVDIDPKPNAEGKKAPLCDQDVQTLLSAFNGSILPPSCAVMSGAGVQFLWIVDGAGSFKPVQAGLMNWAKTLIGDVPADVDQTVKSKSQRLRLPGTLNLKHNKRAELLMYEARYTEEEIVKILDIDLSEKSTPKVKREGETPIEKFNRLASAKTYLLKMGYDIKLDTPISVLMVYPEKNFKDNPHEQHTLKIFKDGKFEIFADNDPRFAPGQYSAFDAFMCHSYGYSFREPVPEDVRKQFMAIAMRDINAHNELIEPTIEEIEHSDDWANWHFIDQGSSGKFVNITTREELSTKAFNMKMYLSVPSDDKGRRAPADKYLSARGTAKIIHERALNPAKGRLFIEGNRTIYNEYNPANVNTPKDALNEEDRMWCALFEWHVLEAICNGEQSDADHLLDWMAWCAQNKGKKALWAPAILSKQQGIGKSLLGNMFASIFGKYVNLELTADQVCSRFTSWKYGTLFTIIEEIKIAGKRRDIFNNNIKAAITNTEVSVEFKGCDPYMTKNITNYMAFSNYENALYMNKDDRRWFVVVPSRDYTELSSMVNSAFMDGLGLTDQKAFETYVNELDRGTKDGDMVSTLHRFLLDRKVKKLPGRAPSNKAKDVMITTESFNDDHWLEELLEVGGDFVKKDTFSYHHLKELYEREKALLNTNEQFSYHLLKRRGFKCLTENAIRIGGERTRIWSREAKNIKEARQILDKTDPKDLF